MATSSNAGAIASAIADPTASVLSKAKTLLSTAMPSTESSSAPAIILGIAAIGFWLGVFIKTSNITSDRRSWRSIRGQVAKVVGSVMIAMFILLVTSIIYFLQDQTKSIYVIFTLVTIASVMSYSALAAAALN
jgi:mannose/fructose/N-acetylgalactosamine-specific phosphotransferase system component IID